MYMVLRLMCFEIYCFQTILITLTRIKFRTEFFPLCGIEAIYLFSRRIKLKYY